MATTYTFKVCDGTTGVPTAFVPQFESASVSFEMSEVGSIAFRYQKAGVNFSSLNINGPVEIAVFQNGIEMEDGRFRLQSLTADEIDQDSVDFTGVSLLDLLDRAKVYSADGSVTQGIDQKFTTATAGAILRTLFNQNAARGTNRVMDRITYSSFSNTLDSNGNAWAFTINEITYTVGVSYLDVIRNLFSNGMIEVKMVGRDLRVYNAGTMGSDKTVIAEPVVLRKGRDLTEAPISSTNEQVAGIVLVVGDNNVLAQYTDTSVTAAWGEDEAFLSQGGIGDATTLGVLSAQEVARRKSVRTENTHKISLASSPWTPYSDYKTSDYIYTDRGNGVTKLRVRQVVLDISAAGTSSASLVLNDKFLEQEIAIARRVNGILGGASATGSVAVPVDPAKPGVDTTIPAQVVSLSWSSAAYQLPNGDTKAQITATWNNVTQNTDTTTITDLDHYETQAKRNSTSAWGNEGIVNSDTNTSYMGAPPGTSMDVRVRAVDTYGNKGAWSATVTNTTASDATPPPVPSTPSVVPYLGQLRIYWDGLGSAAEAMHPDFMYTEVHMSTTNAFTPSNSTLVDQLSAKGYSVQTDLTYGTPYYFKLISVDRSKNKSSASAQASGTPETVTGLDIDQLTIDTNNMAPAAISTAKIADAAIINAKIANLAVDNAKIANMSVGKLTAGSLTADVTVSARIKTADTGARVELNSSGFSAYNASSVKTVDIVASTGAATFMGTFRTDFPTSTNPHILMENASDRTRIYFFDNSGTEKSGKYAYLNVEADASNSPQLALYTGTHAYGSVTSARHRLLMKNSEGILLETLKEPTGDGIVVGGSLFLRPPGTDLSGIRHRLSDGTGTGGLIAVSSAGAFMYRAGGSVENGGYFSALQTSAKMAVYNAGSEAGNIMITDDQRITFKGKFYQDYPNSGTSALYCGLWTINGANSYNYGYGSTYPTTLVPMLSLFRDNTVGYQWHGRAYTEIGFSVWVDSTTSFTVTFWNTRQEG